MVCDVGSNPVIATFVLLSTPNRSAPNTEVETSHASTPNTEVETSHASTCIKLLVCYKWVGWIRRVGGEVEVCEQPTLVRE